MTHDGGTAPKGRSRRWLAAVAALALLAGCAPSAAPSVPPSQANPLADVAVTGGFYDEPAVVFQPPLDVVRPEQRVEISSKGAKVTEDALLLMRYRIYDATSGTQQANTYPAPPIALHMNESELDAATYRALQGARRGERITAVAPSADGATNPALMVIDVLPMTATGTAVKPKPGMPTVKVKKGVPSVAATGTDVPAKLTKSILIEGAGPEIQEGDTITVQSLAVRWDDRTVIESTWQKNEPITAGLDDVVEAWRKALPGVRVGSRVVIVSPPELASGSGATVYVIDVLARAAAGASAEGASPTEAPA